MTLAAVSDAGPLIHLAEVDAVELLSLLEDLYVPEAVVSELEAGTVAESVDDLEWTVVTPAEETLEGADLDAGELAAIAAAVELDAILLTDDLAAREYAAEHGIEVHGSVGVVALGYARGAVTRDEAASFMRRLQRESSLFVTQSVVERGIEMLDG
ncbi:MAG: nucleic acid-binding protein [Halobacterium sp.]